MRSKPSGADLELIARLRAEAEVSVSATQLERWRARGLLPRAEIARDGFGGTRVLPHDDVVVEAAALLGHISRRSSPWQYCALTLFDEGFSLSPDALRGAATFLIELQLKPMRKAWVQAERQASPSDDPDEELAEIGERAAALLPRAVWKLVREEIVLAHPHASLTELHEYLDRAMTWRLVDLNVSGRMTDSQRNLARHGLEEPMPVLGGPGVLPLPSERLLVARTLSWAEADIYREFAHLRRQENPRLAAAASPFVVMTWIVTGERRNAQPDLLDVPLPQEHLERDRIALEEILGELTSAEGEDTASIGEGTS